MMEVLKVTYVLARDVKAQVSQELTQRFSKYSASQLGAEVKEVEGLVLYSLLY